MQYLLSPYNYDLTDPGSIPNLFLQHLTLVGITMLISLIIAIPLGLLAARVRWLYAPLLGVSDVLYTIPSIAMVAFLIPLSGFTLPTVIVPLVIYTQLVLIRNIVTGIHAVDPLMIEVGKAMGMSGVQLFLRVRLPLALPTIVAGVRIATVTTIGLVTITALIGLGGLGQLIYDGLGREFHTPLIVGSVLSVVLAVVADVALLGLQRVATPWARARRVA